MNGTDRPNLLVAQAFLPVPRCLRRQECLSHKTEAIDPMTPEPLAYLNGRLVPLHSELSSGDTVEVVTSKVEGAGPSRDWLQIVVSPRARNKIRQWFSRERREDAIETGREDLVKALRR